MFGEVIRGKSLVRAIENNPTASGDVPIQPVVIEDCGVLSADDPSLAQETIAGADGDIYEDYPEDEDRDTNDASKVFEMAKTIREVGNKLFKEGKLDLALAKYQSKSRPH